MEIILIVFVCIGFVLSSDVDDEGNVSPRLSDLYSTSTVTILSNNDPYGVISIDAEYKSPDNKAQEPGSVTLIVRKTGGSFGSITVQVRSVGGDEQWEGLIDQTPGGTNQTIGQVLANRDINRRALSGRDYSALDATITLDEGETEKLVTLYILDDTLPENDEFVYVYVTSLTDGARVAEPATDSGKKGYIEIPIAHNDFWNGEIGFSSTYLETEGDESNPLTLMIERKIAFFEDVDVYWRAVVDKDSLESRSSRVDLIDQLVTTVGKVNCEAGKALCPFEIKFKNDEVPENATWFLVELFLNDEGSSGAIIDTDRRYSNVTIRDSDNPNGLVQFSQASRLVFLDQSSKRVVLRIERLGYRGKETTIKYITQQQEGYETVAGVRVYSALEGADYERTEGIVIFRTDEANKEIAITMNPNTASDNPLPKMFRIEIYEATNQVSIGEGVSAVTLVDSRDLDVWNVWPEAQKANSNSTLEEVTSQLYNRIRNSLTNQQVTVAQTTLQKVIDAAHAEPVTSGVKTGIMNVLCRLLDPEKDGSVRGKWELTKQAEDFAYSLVQHSSCENGAVTADAEECPYLSIHVLKDYPEGINGYSWGSRQSEYLEIPTKLLSAQDYGKSSSNPKCYTLAIIQYSSSSWFTTGSPVFLNDRILSASLQGEASKFLENPVVYRIYTEDKKTTAKRASCRYFDESSETWTSGNEVCTVTNDLALTIDTFVDCKCKHMSLYAVESNVLRPELIGYPLWFFISCFLCMLGLALAIVCHHLCLTYHAMFAASLHMHLCFAVLATEVCFVIDVYLSPTHLLNIEADESNYRCTVMGLFLHYFFLTQFCWIMTQAINFYKVLVLNDEHTERKYVLFFFTGWGFPVCLLALFYIVTYVIYRYVVDMPEDRIYSDVTQNEDICFVSNIFAALCGAILPPILCLMVAGVIFIQAFQVTSQWQSYDDVYRGRYNLNEVRTLLLFWALIAVTWLFGGLHMAYGQLWMIILFCIFNVAIGIYAFIAYAVLRHPCLPCFRPQKAVLYAASTTAPSEIMPQYMPQQSRPPSQMQAPPSLISNMKEQWEPDSISRTSHIRVKRSVPSTSNVYVIPPHPYEVTSVSHPTDDSRDFDDLIYALKTGASVSNSNYPPSDLSHAIDREVDEVHFQNPAPSDYTEKRRIPIADTHL